MVQKAARLSAPRGQGVYGHSLEERGGVVEDEAEIKKCTYTRAAPRWLASPARALTPEPLTLYAANISPLTTSPAVGSPRGAR